MAYKDNWLYSIIMHWPKHMILVLKLILVVEVWCFVFPLAAIAQALALAVIYSTAYRKDTQKFWPCHHDCHHPPERLCTKTQPDGNSVSTVILFWSFFWPPLLTWLQRHGRNMTYINYMGSLWMRFEYKLVDANRFCPGIHNKTCNE